MANRRDNRLAIPHGCYVYLLIDPNTGAPFYVGKGTGRRMYEHEAAVRGNRARNHAKATIIQRIIARRQHVQYQVLQDGLTDREAIRLERATIHRLGLDALTNANQGTETKEDRTKHQYLHTQATLASVPTITRRLGGTEDARWIAERLHLFINWAAQNGNHNRFKAMMAGAIWRREAGERAWRSATMNRPPAPSLTPRSSATRRQRKNTESPPGR